MVHDAVEETALIACFASSTFELRIPLIADTLPTQSRTAFHSVACGLHADRRIGSRRHGVANPSNPQSQAASWHGPERSVRSRSGPSGLRTLTAIKPTFTSSAGAASNVGEPREAVLMVDPRLAQWKRRPVPSSADSLALRVRRRDNFYPRAEEIDGRTACIYRS